MPQICKKAVTSVAASLHQVGFSGFVIRPEASDTGHHPDRCWPFRPRGLPDIAFRNPRAPSSRWRYGTTRRSPLTGVPAQSSSVSETCRYRYVPSIRRKPLPCGRPGLLEWAAAGSGPGFTAWRLIAFPGCSRVSFRTTGGQVQRQTVVVPGVPDVHRRAKKRLRL